MKERMWIIVVKRGDSETLHYVPHRGFVESWELSKADVVRQFMATKGTGGNSWIQLTRRGYRCVRAAVTWGSK